MKQEHLKEYARHDSFETTKTFYAGENLDATENAAWAQSANTPTNIPGPAKR